MKEKITTIVTIAIAIIAVLFVAKLLFVPENPYTSKTISANGNSDITAQPDEAVAYLRIDVLRSTAEIASSDAKAKYEAVSGAMIAYPGAKFELQSYNLQEMYNWLPNGSQQSKGFQASYYLKATTKNLAEIGKIVDAGVSNGVSSVDSVQFTLSTDATEKVRAEVLKKAAENAKMQAESLAIGLGQKLGDVVSVSEGGYYAPPIYFAKMADVANSGGRAESVSVGAEPSSIQVSASVTVTYKIK